MTDIQYPNRYNLKTGTQLGILKLAEKKPSQFNAADVMWLHRWLDNYLVPYLAKLEAGQLGQQNLGAKID